MKPKQLDLQKSILNQYLSKYNGDLRKAIHTEMGLDINILEARLSPDKDHNLIIWYNDTKSEKRLEFSDLGIKIDDTLIDDDIFSHELHNFAPELKEELTNNLITWISEKDHNDRDIEPMKNDLIMIMGVKDDCFFSSILTNEYVIESTDKKGFDAICNELLELNKKITEFKSIYDGDFNIDAYNTWEDVKGENNAS